jgi:hypothetical protein
MKKSIFLLALTSLFVLPSTLFAQYTFPLAEFIKMTGQNASDFETTMLEKDYSLQTKLSSAVNKIYTSDKKGAEGKQYTIPRKQVPGASVALTFTTTDKKHYLDTKAKLASSGYKFVKEENKPINNVPATWFLYTNGAYKVSICSYTTDVKWFVVEAHL